MKKILFVLSMLISVSTLFAQAPQGINYQGVARNNIGAALSNTVITVQFTIKNTTGTVYQENRTANTDTFGLYSLVIGGASGTANATGTFSVIPWAAGNLSIQIDINGSTVATSVLQSVPYALYAGSAGSSSSSGITTILTNTTLISSTGTPTVDLSLATLAPNPANTYGDSTHYPIITVDQYGRVTNATIQTIVPGGITSVTTVAPLTETVFASGAVIVGTSTTIAAGMVGSATQIPVITYDQYGRITNVSTQTISGSTLPTPTVGSLLYSDPSNAWTATNPNSIFTNGTHIGIGTSTPGSALEVQGGSGTAGTFANTGNIAALVINASSSSGSPSAQFSGGSGLSTDNITNSNSITTSSLTVGNGFHLSLNANPFYVLTSDNMGNGTWQPTPTGVSSIIPGTGINTATAGGTVSVSAMNGTALWNANELQSVSISTITPTPGQILEYNGTQWVAAPPPVAGASNGLSVATGSVVLGGPLTGATTISQSVNNMLFQSSTTGNVQISNANNTNGALAVTNISTASGNALNVTSNGTGNTIVGTNLGTGGNAASFINNSASNGAAALNAYTGGSGNAINATSVTGTAINASNSGGNTISAQNTGTVSGAGNFTINNGSNNTTALSASTNGTGNTAVFSVINPSNGNYALNAQTNGSGAAIYAANTGTVSTSGGAIIAFTPTGNNAPVILATAGGSGNSGKFTGGAGLYTDNITINTGAIAAGSVLTSTNTTGGAAWVLPAAPVSYAATGAAQTINTGTVASTANYGTVTYNYGGGSYTPTAYTSTVTGVYHVDACLAIPTPSISATYGSISIIVGGTILKTVDFAFPQYSSTPFNVSPHISGDVNITSPSTQPISISIQITSTGGPSTVTTVGTAATSWFNVHLVH